MDFSFGTLTSLMYAECSKNFDPMDISNLVQNSTIRLRGLVMVDMKSEGPCIEHGILGNQNLSTAVELFIEQPASRVD